MIQVYVALVSWSLENVVYMATYTSPVSSLRTTRRGERRRVREEAVIFPRCLTSFLSFGERDQESSRLLVSFLPAPYSFLFYKKIAGEL